MKPKPTEPPIICGATAAACFLGVIGALLAFFLSH